MCNVFRFYFSHQISLTMDPSHLVTPPRAHPSGSAANSIDDHHQQRKQPQSLIHEPWFIVLISIVVLLFSFIATVGMIFFRGRHQITKEVGHLNGKWLSSVLLGKQRTMLTTVHPLCSSSGECKRYNCIEYKWERKSLDWSWMERYGQRFGSEWGETVGQLEYIIARKLYGRWNRLCRSRHTKFEHLL